MRWVKKPEIQKPSPKRNDVRCCRRFAFFPIDVEYSDKEITVWLEAYYSLQLYTCGKEVFEWREIRRFLESPNIADFIF
jgi:hypothetical protein